MHLSATLSRAREKSQGRDYERSQRCHLCEIDREKMWRCEVQKFPFSDDQLLLALELGNWATLIKNIEDLFFSSSWSWRYKPRVNLKDKIPNGIKFEFVKQKLKQWHVVNQTWRSSCEPYNTKYTRKIWCNAFPAVFGFDVLVIGIKGHPDCNRSKHNHK